MFFEGAAKYSLLHWKMADKPECPSEGDGSKRPSEGDGSERPGEGNKSKRQREGDGSELKSEGNKSKRKKRVTFELHPRDTARDTQADAPPSARHENARLAMVASAVSASMLRAIASILYSKARQAAAMRSTQEGACAASKAKVAPRLTRLRLRELFTPEDVELVNAVKPAVLAASKGIAATILRDAFAATAAAAARRRGAGGAVAAAAAASL